VAEGATAAVAIAAVRSSLEALEQRLTSRETALADERASTSVAAAAATDALDEEIEQLRARAAAAAALLETAEESAVAGEGSAERGSALADRVAALESTLAAREVELARVVGTRRVEEKDAGARAVAVIAERADLQKKLLDAESQLAANEGAAGAAKSVETALRARLDEAEVRRESAAAAVGDERAALGCEVARLEDALAAAEASAAAAAVETRLASNRNVAALEVQVTRLTAATADVHRRQAAEAAAVAAAETAAAAADETARGQLADARRAAAAVERDLTGRVRDMTERAANLEAELVEKSTSARERERLREEIIALEADRADQVGELERQVADLMDALRTKERAMRAIKSSKTSLTNDDAGGRLETSKIELEARLADSLASLEAERARLTAEGTGAAAKAKAKAASLQANLEILRETLAARDVTLAEAEAAADTLRNAADDLGVRLSAAETQRAAGSAYLHQEIQRLRSASVLASRDFAAVSASLADARTAAATAAAAAAAATSLAGDEADALRWKLLAQEELKSAGEAAASAAAVDTDVDVDVDAVSGAEGVRVDSSASRSGSRKSPSKSPKPSISSARSSGSIERELRRRLTELEGTAAARTAELTTLYGDKATLEKRLASKAAGVAAAERESATAIEVRRLTTEVAELTRRSTDLQAALAAKEELERQLGASASALEPSSEVSAPFGTPRPTSKGLFTDPSDLAVLEAGAHAARLEVLLNPELPNPNPEPRTPRLTNPIR
jgi:chromosome segregation ATPase